MVGVLAAAGLELWGRVKGMRGEDETKGRGGFGGKRGERTTPGDGTL